MIKQTKQPYENDDVESDTDELSIKEDNQSSNFDVETDNYEDEQLTDDNLKINADIQQDIQDEQLDYQKQYIVPPEKRITRNILSKLEFVSLTGQRAIQIEKTGIHFAMINPDYFINNSFNALQIAQIEILQKQCPLQLKRQISNKYVELFDVNTMILPKIKFPTNIILAANNKFE